MCLYCTRYRREAPGPPPSCDAFPLPGGIPTSIFESRFDHRRAYVSDNGLRFELAPGFTMEQATDALR